MPFPAAVGGLADIGDRERVDGFLGAVGCKAAIFEDGST